MTLAPVIGGSERQGFGKYSLCSGRKRTDREVFKKGSMLEKRRQIYHYSHFSFTSHNIDLESESLEHYNEKCQMKKIKELANLLNLKRWVIFHSSFYLFYILLYISLKHAAGTA